jgi:hypothetical protein
VYVLAFRACASQAIDAQGGASDDARLRDAAFALLQLERDIFGLWCQWLFRPLSDAGEKRASQAFKQAMRMVDDALARVGGSGPYFLGCDISMVDFMFVPFMERQAASLLYWKGYKIRNGGYDNIDRCALGPSDVFDQTCSVCLDVGEGDAISSVAPEWGPGLATAGSMSTGGSRRWNSEAHTLLRNQTCTRTAGTFPLSTAIATHQADLSMRPPSTAKMASPGTYRCLLSTRPPLKSGRTLWMMGRSALLC